MISFAIFTSLLQIPAKKYSKMCKYLTQIIYAKNLKYNKKNFIFNKKPLYLAKNPYVYLAKNS